LYSIACFVPCLSLSYNFISSAEYNICNVYVTKACLSRVPNLPLLKYIYHRQKQNALKHLVELVSLTNSKSPWISAANGSWLSPESRSELYNPADPSHKGVTIEVPTTACTRLYGVIFKGATIWALDKIYLISAQSVFVNESDFEALEMWRVFSGQLKYWRRQQNTAAPCQICIHFLPLTINHIYVYNLNKTVKITLWHT
jgi:hypothetical protein